jgi:hypothetical protein
MPIELPDESNCRPYSPQQVQSLLEGVPFSWWITGDWALDLLLAHQTRPHFDIDIAIPRASQMDVPGSLKGWEFWSIRRDEKDELILREWTNNNYLGFDFPGVWAREVNDTFWRFEFLFQEITDNVWTFRYGEMVRRSIEEITLINQQGIPYLRPEIVLLTKAVRQRAVDLDDFLNILPSLNASQRLFLSEDIRKINPNHAWLSWLR